MNLSNSFDLSSLPKTALRLPLVLKGDASFSWSWPIESPSVYYCGEGTFIFIAAGLNRSWAFENANPLSILIVLYNDIPIFCIWEFSVIWLSFATELIKLCVVENLALRGPEEDIVIPLYLNGFCRVCLSDAKFELESTP